MVRLPFSISEMWRCGIPVSSASLVWVSSSLLRAPRNTDPGTSPRRPATRRHGIESAFSSVSTYLVMLVTLAGCTMRCNGTSFSVGSFFVRANILHLHKSYDVVNFFPNGNVCRFAGFDMAMMLLVSQLRVVFPVASNRPECFDFSSQEVHPVLNRPRKSIVLLHHFFAEINDPCHMSPYTIF